MPLSLAIGSFTPSSGPVGTVITISGIGFTAATAVLIAGIAATSFTVVNDSTITAVVPAGFVKGNITVTLPTGSEASQFHYKLTP